MASSLLEQWGAIRPTDRNTHSELREIRTCPPNRSYIVGVEVMGLAPDVEPLPHQALGPRELRVTATHQGECRHIEAQRNRTEQNRTVNFRTQSSVKVLEWKIPCSSWWCCCHLSLLLRGTLMQPKRLLLAAKNGQPKQVEEAKQRQRQLFVFYKQSL